MIRVAVLASGSGSNAKCIMQYFQNHKTIQIALVASNKADAGVLDHAQKFNVPTYTFTKEELNSGNVLLELEKQAIDFIVLAGFLALIPQTLVSIFSQRILNIHPSLLPHYGGKGMYGMHVHTAVKEQQESKSGITIHLVNEEFDKGKVLFQASTAIKADDTADQIQSKVLVVEHQYFSSVIESYILSRKHHTS